jgi:hypothetical protein
MENVMAWPWMAVTVSMVPCLKMKMQRRMMFRRSLAPTAVRPIEASTTAVQPIEPLLTAVRPIEALLTAVPLTEEAWCQTAP